MSDRLTPAAPSHSVTLALQSDDPALRDVIAAEVRRQVAAAVRDALSPYLTVEEAAEYLRCKRGRIDKLTSMGALRKYKEGGRVLLRRDELDAFVRAGGATT